ncbi:MAG TPA: DUF6691 family protein [Gemmatimonadaceae bacterium]|nr:DUF6691 family protein [Gemmatimonadaceae bacterium]
MALLYGLLVGVAMGALLQRVRASSPGVILGALRLENLTIIKFMATTIAVGMIGVYALAALGVPMHFDIKPTYLVGVVLGGLVFGAGFALGGYCPGTCVVGAGEGRKDALAAIAGGIAGALLFTLVYPAMERAIFRPLDFGKITLPGVLHLPPVVVAVAMAAIIFGVLRLLPTERRAGASGGE